MTGTTIDPRRERDLIVAEVPGRRHSGAQTKEGGEKQGNHIPDPLIWIEDDIALPVIDKTDRQLDPELTTSRLTQHATEQARTEHVELGLAHGSLESEQKTVVEMGGVVNAVFVDDQGAGMRTQLQQAMPVTDGLS